MGKNLKIRIKNTQIAKALKLDGLKDKLAKKGKASKDKDEAKSEEAKAETAESLSNEEKAPPAPKRKVRARSRSAFAEEEQSKQKEQEEKVPSSKESSEEIETQESQPEPASEKKSKEEKIQESPKAKKEAPPPKVKRSPIRMTDLTKPRRTHTPTPEQASRPKLGPTGKHIRDLVPPKPEKPPKENKKETKKDEKKPPRKSAPNEPNQAQADSAKDKGKSNSKMKEYRDVRPRRKMSSPGSFDARDRQGLRTDDEGGWRKKRRNKKQQEHEEIQPDLPTALKIRLPTTVKDLAERMKLKASQLIGKLFMQGIVVTLNECLDDETTVQLLGEEFGCSIEVDTSEEERIRITDKTVREEIEASDSKNLLLRAPVVTFMGHVDHGKTSLIDCIRASNIADGEAGAITQHIGAFRTKTDVGDLTILDTPGHEAFSAMRARGADMTDIVVLVVAGDEGMRQQTEEAIDHAKAAGVTIIVAINKSDKPNFDPEVVYRQLSEKELLPEAWGGTTITVNCSAKTQEGIPELLEMLALQAEVLELRANPQMRARGTVVESEMHRGLGNVASILIQNGTLRIGDAVVFNTLWGRIKTMKNDLGQDILEAGPSTPVEITGLSGLPLAGDEFIVVADEKEAKDIAEARQQEAREKGLALQRRPVNLENLLQEAKGQDKKVLNVVVRADVQGSLEALKTALMKIESEKVNLNIIATGVGQISESDVTLAAASSAMILGFHTDIESHAEPLIKDLNVQVKLHDIIYHAVDEVKNIMTGLLDKVAQEEHRATLEVRATFKASQLGRIAGCFVEDGKIHRNHHVRILREGEEIWKGKIAGLKRLKDDVREVAKGFECGVLLENFNEVQEGDVIEAFEIVYIDQKL